MKNKAVHSYGSFNNPVRGEFNQGKSALSQQRDQVEKQGFYLEKVSEGRSGRFFIRHPVKSANNEPSIQKKLLSVFCLALVTSAELTHVINEINAAPKSITKLNKQRAKKEEVSKLLQVSSYANEETIRKAFPESVNKTQEEPFGNSSSMNKEISNISSIFSRVMGYLPSSFRTQVASRIDTLTNFATRSIFILAFGSLGSVLSGNLVQAEEAPPISIPHFQPSMELHLDKLMKIMFIVLNHDPLKPYADGEIASLGNLYENAKEHPILEGQIKPFAHEMHNIMQHYHEYHEKNPNRADFELKASILSIKMSTHIRAGQAGIVLALLESASTEVLGEMVNGIAGEHLEKAVGISVNWLANGLVRLDPTVTKDEATAAVGMLLGTVLISRDLNSPAAKTINKDLESSLFSSIKNAAKSPMTVSNSLRGVKAGLYETSVDQIIDHSRKAPFDTSGTAFDSAYNLNHGNAFDQIRFEFVGKSEDDSMFANTKKSPVTFDDFLSQSKVPENAFDQIKASFMGVNGPSSSFKDPQKSFFSSKEFTQKVVEPYWKAPETSPFELHKINPISNPLEAKSYKYQNPFENNLVSGNALDHMKYQLNMHNFNSQPSPFSGGFTPSHFENHWKDPSPASFDSSSPHFSTPSFGQNSFKFQNPFDSVNNLRKGNAFNQIRPNEVFGNNNHDYNNRKF